LAACRTSPPPVGSTSNALTREEAALAKALAHYVQGLLYEFEQGRLSDRAREHYRQAAELDPTESRLYSQAAAMALLRGAPHEAVATLEQACRAAPRAVEPRLNLATVYQLTGQLELAARTYSEATRLSPTNPLPYTALAVLYFYQDRTDKALRTLEAGLRHTSTNDQRAFLAFCYNQGMRLARSGNWPAAIKCYRFTARHSPNDRAYFQHLIGEAYELLKQPQLAARWFRKSIRNPEPFPPSYVKLALLQLPANPDYAIKILREGEKRMPENLLIPLALAQIYGSQGRFAEAVKIFDKIAAQVGSNPTEKLTASFYLHYGAMCDRAGLPQKAEAIMEEGLHYYPDAHEILNYLAYTWAEKNVNLEKALDYVTRALQSEPQNGAYLDTLGWIYFRQKKYEDALREIKKADERIPNDPTVIEHLGDVYDALRRKDEALDAWMKSYRINPQNTALREKLRSLGVDPDQKQTELRKAPGAAE